jgi:guanylate kinase
MDNYHPIILVGPQGAGKSTIAKHLEDHFDSCIIVRSFSDRPRRKSGGPETVICISAGAWMDRFRLDKFIAVTERNDHHYGVPIVVIEAILYGLGMHPVLVLDKDGAREVRSHFPRSKVIHVMPPSEEILRYRLQIRGSSPESIERAVVEYRGWEADLDFGIINTDSPTVREDLEPLTKYLDL